MISIIVMLLYEIRRQRMWYMKMRGGIVIETRWSWNQLEGGRVVLRMMGK